MSIKKLWAETSRHYDKAAERRHIAEINWRTHALLIQGVLEEFRQAASEDGYYVGLEAYDGRVSPGSITRPAPMGESVIGVEWVRLQLESTPTGEGLITVESETKYTRKMDFETGAGIIFHFSPRLGAIQVFLEEPHLSTSERRRESLLIDHTFDPYSFPRDRVIKNLKKLMIYSRVESSREDPTWLDRRLVMWWRFLDIRNRRGYLEQFHHFFTPWELLILTVVTAGPVVAGLATLWKYALGSS